LHLACRRGDVSVVRFLIDEAKVRVNVQDDYGRTPFHDAMWTCRPVFEVMDVLLRASSPEMLLYEDVRGHTPFHYARREHYEDWLRFVNERKEVILKRLSLV
jgi:ankyrin repeat protein